MSDPAQAEVLYEVSGGIATLTLNRPERLNAITRPMLALLSDLLLRANADPAVRVVLLTGAGRAFCVGLDIADAVAGKGIGANNASDPVSVNLDLRNTPPTVLFNLDKPTICALNGSAAGYGFDTALGCDMRVMAESAKMAAAFVKRGIVPESGGTWYLPRLLGWAKACEVAMLGETLSAEQSVAYGLANKAVPAADFEAEVDRWADRIAANAPLAVTEMKRLFRHGLTQDFESHSHHVLMSLLNLFRSNDFKEGVQSFVERRDPVFRGE